MKVRRCVRCKGGMLPEWPKSERCPECNERLEKWGANVPRSYAYLRPEDSATPIADYRDGRLELAHAVLRFAQLCNGVDAQFIGDEFGADDRERNGIQSALRRYARQGLLRTEGSKPGLVYFPVRQKARAA